MDEVYCMCSHYEMDQLITKLKLGVVLAIDQRSEHFLVASTTCPNNVLANNTNKNSWSRGICRSWLRRITRVKFRASISTPSLSTFYHDCSDKMQHVDSRHDKKCFRLCCGCAVCKWWDISRYYSKELEQCKNYHRVPGTLLLQLQRHRIRSSLFLFCVFNMPSCPTEKIKKCFWRMVLAN